MGKSFREPFLKIKRKKKMKFQSGRKSEERNVLSLLERADSFDDPILDIAEALEMFDQLRVKADISKRKATKALFRHQNEDEFEDLDAKFRRK